MIDDPTVATLRVKAETAVADDVVSLTLADPEGRRLADWAPGAHVDLVLPAPCDPAILAARRPLGRLLLPRRRPPRAARAWRLGAYVHDDPAPGDLVGVGAQRNNFHLLPYERYLFLAGGIGITPMLPMIQQADLLGAGWQLLYGERRRASSARAALGRCHGRVRGRPASGERPP